MQKTKAAFNIRGQTKFPVTFTGFAEDNIYGRYKVWISISEKGIWTVEFDYWNRHNGSTKERYSGKLASAGGTLISHRGHDTLTFFGFERAICRASCVSILELTMENAFYGFTEEVLGYVI